MVSKINIGKNGTMILSNAFLNPLRPISQASIIQTTQDSKFIFSPKFSFRKFSIDSNALKTKSSEQFQKAVISPPPLVVKLTYNQNSQESLSNQFAPTMKSQEDPNTSSSYKYSLDRYRIRVSYSHNKQPKKNESQNSTTIPLIQRLAQMKNRFTPIKYPAAKSVPSIQKAHQARYGYQKCQNGILIKRQLKTGKVVKEQRPQRFNTMQQRLSSQSPPQRNSSYGRNHYLSEINQTSFDNDQIPGPGQYELGSTLNRNSGPKWSASLSFRVNPELIQSANFNVGPGSYGYDEAPQRQSDRNQNYKTNHREQKSNSAKQTSVFKSKSCRLFQRISTSPGYKTQLTNYNQFPQSLNISSNCYNTQYQTEIIKKIRQPIVQTNSKALPQYKSYNKAQQEYIN